MIKITKVLGIAATVGVVGYLGLAGYVYYHDKQRITMPEQASLSAQNAAVLKTLSEKGCDYCHTPSAKLPFYSQFPIAKQLMEYDINLGYKSFDLTPIRNSLIHDTPPPQGDIAKVEWVMQHNTMPPTRYTALHWAGSLSEEERKGILNWVKDQRIKYYAAKDMSPALMNEPVQPLPRTIPVQADKVALGFRLYHDPRLSGDNSLSPACIVTN